MFVAVILQRHIKSTSVGPTQYFAYATFQSVLTYVRLYKSGNANPTHSPMASHRWLVSEQPTYILILVCYDDSCNITGEGQGDVLAEERDFSLSSGSSTELIRMLRAESSRLLCTGLDGAVKQTYKHQH